MQSRYKAAFWRTVPPFPVSQRLETGNYIVETDLGRFYMGICYNSKFEQVPIWGYSETNAQRMKYHAAYKVKKAYDRYGGQDARICHVRKVA